MIRRRSFLSFMVAGVAVGRRAGLGSWAKSWSGVAPDSIEEKLAEIEALVEEAIREGKCPGAVVVVGHGGKEVYRRAFGQRALVPRKLAMTPDTIFDLASLTKVVATTTAVGQLVERGKIRLEEPAGAYWPEFKSNGKETITVRQLLTHYSGLRPDLDLKPEWAGYESALRMILEEKPSAWPGTRFIYSDINFEILGELVHRITGDPLDVYCAEHIFKPLGMRDTGFRRLASGAGEQDRARIAPTQYQSGTRGKMLWGEVHDPTAYNMGGVAGHAGLFSTADDLALFAQMLLEGGSLTGAKILSPLIVEKMTTPQSPPRKMAVRGLGWDIDSPFASPRGNLFPVGSYGHTGFTGTSIWIDPFSSTYVIILSNRVHPDGEGDVGALRAKIATRVASALPVAAAQQMLAARSCLTGGNEMSQSYPARARKNHPVKTGIDVLEAENFTTFAGLRVGLVTNHTGLDSAGRRTMDLLHGAANVKLKAIFSPEHGLGGTEDRRVPSGRDAATGLPVHSLYGEVERPTAAMLEGLDALVFDIQDMGVRFYTYASTLGYTLQGAAEKGLDYFVLDRPVPINGFSVEGPVLDVFTHPFVGYFPMPVRHGMTVGELAQMFNAEKKLGAKLRVIKMRGWERQEWFDETGLTWVNPSPNLRNLTEATLYPGVAMVEWANVSVGRGTDTPFELLGAPWTDARALAGRLNTRQIQGVRFVPVSFRPESGPFQGQVCQGVNILLLDREALDAALLGVELASALYQLNPGELQLEKSLPLIGATWVLEAIRKGEDPLWIFLRWQEPLEQFRKVRARYLLY